MLYGCHLVENLSRLEQCQNAKYICMTYLNYADITKVDYSKNPTLGEAYLPGHSSAAAKTLGYT